MKKEQRPPQIENLLAKIRECIDKGRYRESFHAKQRQNERNIDLFDALYVLKNGYHEKQKTAFNELRKTWNYAIRHKLEGKEIRVIVGFECDGMLIITVMYVTKS